MPGHPEPRALLALMLLHDARRDARVRADGSVVLLEEQIDVFGTGNHPRRARTRRGGAPNEAAGPYALQAAIAGVHAQADAAEQTDWRRIASLYAVLLRVNPTPVIALNHAVAVAMADGPEAGLRLIDCLTARETLPGYHLLPAARADSLRRLGRREEAADAYRAALSLVSNDADRRFLEQRRRSDRRACHLGGRFARLDHFEESATIDLTQIHRQWQRRACDDCCEASLLGKGLRGGGATWIELRFAPFA